MTGTETRITAILHHNLRGSGREVIVQLENTGLSLTTMRGEPIAVWLYDSLGFAGSQENAESAEIRVQHEALLTLRLFGRQTIEEIISRSPALRAQRKEARTNKALQIWDGIPAGPQAGVFVALILGGIWVVSWLRDLFE